MGTFRDDLRLSIETCIGSGNYSAFDQILHLTLDYTLKKLANLDDERFAKYLDSIQVWRELPKATIFRTVGSPSIALAGVRTTSGRVVIALAICDELPGDGIETWWNEVVGPRAAVL